MEKLRLGVEGCLRCLEHWKPVVELVLAIAAVFIAFYAAQIAARSDATFKEEANLLADAKTVVEQENKTFNQGVAILDATKGLVSQATELIKQTKELLARETMHMARDDFDKLLDEADQYCVACPQCSPTYPIIIPLEKASRREEEVAAVLTAAEYNRLAMLGSSVWDVEKTKSYVTKAMDKERATRGTAKEKEGGTGVEVDDFVSHLVLGHLYFVHLKDDEPANLKRAEENFREAIKALPVNSGNDAIRAYIGQGYAIWSAHEAFLKRNDESSQLADWAIASWKGLSDHELFEKELDERRKAAADGVMPQIACLFKAGPCCSCVAPTAAPAPGAPLPAPPRAPGVAKERIEVKPAEKPAEKPAQKPAQKPVEGPPVAPAPPPPADWPGMIWRTPKSPPAE